MRSSLMELGFQRVVVSWQTKVVYGKDAHKQCLDEKVHLCVGANCCRHTLFPKNLQSLCSKFAQECLI